MIFYVSSMDQYGPAASTGVFGGGNAENSGWTIDNDIMLGDGWANLPSYVNGNFRYSPVGELKIAEPSWGARQGDYALIADGMEITSDGGTGQPQTRGAEGAVLLSIPGASADTRFLHIAFGISSLPVARGHGYICHFQDANNDIRASLRVNSSGRLELLDGAPLTANGNSVYTAEPAVLLSSAAPVISPNTWYSLNIRIVTNGTDETANFDCYVGDIAAPNLVLSGTGLAFTDTASAQPGGDENHIDVYGFLPASLSAVPSAGSDDNERAIRDIVLYDGSGTYNNTFLGQVFCSAQEMRAEDDEGDNWSSHSRQKIGNGVLNAHTNNTGIRLADAAGLEIGASDFTFETFARFSAIPSATGEICYLLGKWFTAANQSYRLIYSADDQAFIWEVSTDGAAATVIKSAPVTLLPDRWTHIAVSRWSETADAYLNIFIDGVAIGAPVVDNNTYFDGSASLGIGADFAGGSTPDSATAFDGFLEETRFTIGVGRYTDSFAVPTAAFGRNVGDDPNFASVVLLMGYEDGVIEDESSAARTLTINASPVTADQPNDGSFSYQVLNQRPAWDDTYIEAAYLYAEGVFTLLGQPANGETMTIGAQTYTWVTSFSTAPEDEILIGASVAASISNAIAAVNNGAGEGTTYGTGTTANASATAIVYLDEAFALRAITIGAAGNSVATTETVANGSFRAATLTGGQDIPSPSDFTIERLPIDVSGVLAVQATARFSKTDAGTASARLDFVGPAAAVETGSALPVDLNPSWQRQIFEEDPDTSASLTPSSIIGGRLRFTRVT